MKKALLGYFKYFLLYFLSIVYWEFIIRLQIGEIRASNLFFLLFVPAESMFFAWFSVAVKGKACRIITPIVMFLVTFFYLAQCIYFKNFGSLFSVSMAGMGAQALGNFWWALKDTLLENVGVILLIFLPLAVTIIISIIRKTNVDSIKLWIKGVMLASVAALWGLGILLLMAFGTGRQSAYFVFTNALSDTDTTVNKFGALTTSIVEAGAYYLGMGVDADDLISNELVSESDFVVPVIVPVEPVTSTEKGDEEATPDADIPEVVEPEPVQYWVDERIDFNELLNTTDDKELQAMCKYFASRSGSKKNEYTGIFEGYNLIYICAESFWTYAIDEKVTPTLYKMANNGVILNNFYNSFKNTTTNGEYAFVTSLWPNVSRKANMGKQVGSFPQSSMRYMPQGLGKLFKNVGASAYGFHNYKGSYYGRDASWPNLGYECYFSGTGMRFTTAWPASDYEMMEQSIPKYINDEQFHAYYMTFSGHGSYAYDFNTGEGNAMVGRNYQTVIDALGSDNKLSDKAVGYLSANYELEKAMTYLLDELDKAGKLDNTVIVICGDHYPYYLFDGDRKSLAGHKIDENFGIYESTCIIYNEGLKEPIVSDNYCCNVDILPTMLNMFNIPFDSRLMMGNDIFSDNIHKAVLYNQSFATEYVKYDNINLSAEWSDLTAEWTEEQKENYLQGVITLNETEASVSTHILVDDFFKFVYKNSGIMTPEEEQAEEERISGLHMEDTFENFDEINDFAD